MDSSVIVTTAVVGIVLVLCYGLPIVHIATSNRTTGNQRVIWIVMTLCFGLLGYALWFIMNPTEAGQIARATRMMAQANPAPPQGRGMVQFTRGSFFGALVLYSVYLDDHTAPPVAQIRGRGSALVAVAPGRHTVWVKGYRWLEFPFDIAAGQVLSFSLDTKAETLLTNTVVGFVPVNA